jgi:heme A synthase
MYFVFSILLQLRPAIFASKLKLTIHFLTAAATTALLLWASQSYGQLKLSDKAKDAKASAAFWRDTLTLFSHVLEAVSIIPQADMGGWTSYAHPLPPLPLPPPPPPSLPPSGLSSPLVS